MYLRLTLSRAVMAAAALGLMLLLMVTPASGSPPTDIVWTFTEVSSADFVGQGVSLAISPVSGQPFISYYDATHGDLYAATYVANGGNCGHDTWQCKLVDGSGLFVSDVGAYSSIAVDPATGYPAIAYYDTTNRRLKYASAGCAGVDCTWTRSIIEDEPLLVADRVGLYPSLKIGSDSVARVAYQRTSLNYGGLKYAEQVGSGGNCGSSASWQCSVVESSTGFGKYPSLELTASLTPLNVPYIASYDSVNGNLRYAWYVGNGQGNCGSSNWNCLIVDETGDVGAYPALSISNGGGFGAIAYLARDTGYIKIAQTWSGTFPGNCGFGIMQTKWQCDNLYNTGVTANPAGVSLARLPGGSPVAVFGCPACYGSSIMSAAYVGLGGNCGATKWNCKTIISGPNTSYDYSQYLDAALSGDKLLTIAYAEATVGDVFVGMERLKLYLPISIME